jgi:oligoribonuclease (3'-5' exoribonuclease)
VTTAFAFIDLESDGLDADCVLLEVAWVVTGPALLNYHQIRHRFIWHDGTDPYGVWEHMHPKAREMHDGSGLRTDWWEWANRRRARCQAHNLAEVDAAITADIEASKATLGADKVMFAGSGIGPFDVPLIRRHLPRAAAAVHYRPLDISSVREMGLLLGLAPPWPDGERPHRAAGDVEWSIRDARWWRNVMGTAARLAGAS